jgi:hypothetical protein
MIMRLVNARLWVLAATLALALPSQAQKSDIEAKAEIAFARGLASQFTFVNLAEEVIADLEKAGVSAEMKGAMGLVKCEVYSIGARGERDTAKKHELYEEALRLYDDFIKANGLADERATAEAAFVNTSATYAAALDLALEEAVGERVEQIKTRQAEILTEAIKRTQDLIEGLESLGSKERSQAQARELYTLMLNRGNMLAEVGKTQTDGTYYFEQGVQTLEALVFIAGEGTPPALRSFNAIGVIYAHQNMWEDAAAYFEAVIEQTLPTDPEVWAKNSKDLTDGQKAVRFLFVELATAGAVEAFANSGDMELACTYALHLYNQQRKEGFSFSGAGYLSLLASARVLLDSGGWVGGNLTTGEAKWYATEEEIPSSVPRRHRQNCVDFALRIAQTVNDDNKGNVLQIRGQKLISEIIERPSVEVSPDLLFQAAQGEYRDGQYEKAVDGFHRVMRAIESQDDATKQLYGAKVMNHLGRSYRKLGRPLEAAMAFQEGCTTWVGDSEYDSLNAQSFYTIVGTYNKGAISDREPLTKLHKTAEKLVTAIGGRDEDKIQWSNGEKARNAKDYATAITKYKQITTESSYYEKAVVAIGRCKHRQGKVDEAFTIFDDYLTQWVTDPANDSESPARLAKRKESMALAEFFRGLIAYTRAVASENAAKEEGAEVTSEVRERLRLNYQQVIDYLKDYSQTYADQLKLANWAVDNVMRSHIFLEDRDGARADLERMVELAPNEDRTRQASVRFYNTLKSALEGAEDPTVILTEMAEHLHRANQTSSASFANLRRESQHWSELERWAEAEESLTKILTRFADDPEQAAGIESFIKPDLGIALIKQQKMDAAKAILNPLVMGENARPSKKTIMNWSRSIVGWVEGERQMSIIVGAGGTDEELQEVVTKISAIAASGDKWVDCEWYEQKFLVAYTYFVWSQTNSSKKDSVKGQISDITDMTGTDFKELETWCDHEETPEAVRARLGNGTLKARFQWLGRQK